MELRGRASVSRLQKRQLIALGSELNAAWVVAILERSLIFLSFTNRQRVNRSKGALSKRRTPIVRRSPLQRITRGGTRIICAHGDAPAEPRGSGRLLAHYRKRR